MSLSRDQMLVKAASQGNLAAVKKQIKLGADVLFEDCLALQLAANSDYFDVVEALLDAGAEVHADRDQPLRVAASSGRVKMAEYLLRAGADLHVYDDVALRLAAGAGHAATVDLLLRFGANVHSCSDQALRRGAKFPEVAAVLISAGADLTQLFHQNDIVGDRDRLRTINKHAAKAFRGIEAVMMFGQKSRIKILQDIYPGLEEKKIIEELIIMMALSLSPSQMAEIWQTKHKNTPSNEVDAAP